MSAHLIMKLSTITSDNCSVAHSQFDEVEHIYIHSAQFSLSLLLKLTMDVQLNLSKFLHFI